MIQHDGGQWDAQSYYQKVKNLVKRRIIDLLHVHIIQVANWADWKIQEKPCH